MDEFEDFEITQDILTEIENIEINLLDKTLNLSSDDDEEQIRPPRSSYRRLRIPSSSEGSDGEIGRAIQDLDRNSSSKWTDPKGNQRNVIPFTECCGMPVSIRTSMINKSPKDFYALLVTDSLLQHIVECTNAFAMTKITRTAEASKNARIRSWSETNLAEMKHFFCLILYMGLVKLPKIADYWSKDEIMGQNFPRTVMSRNRFELLLQMIHFSQDDDNNQSDRLHRVKHLLDVMNDNFKRNYIPGQNICIDESMVPFRGRLIFRQYNKQKRHKYGIKLFKLCTLPGYTYRINIYAGKQHEEINVTPQRVVMNLCQDLLNKGHCLYTDNWYTSVDLARELLKNETHLIGTLRKNRKHFPKVVVSTKLRKGQFIARESDDGITVLRWKDKRDVLVLSTKHSTRFISVTKHNKTKMKPAIVVDYNKAKGAVDLSDQMAAYQTPLRKTLKWYKKIAFDLILNIAMVNALVLYKTVTNKHIPIVELRKEILKSFLAKSSTSEAPSERTIRKKHVLQKKEGPSLKVRRMCVECYKNNVTTFGRALARNKTKKVPTFCDTCVDKPFLCVECFANVHV